MRTPKAKKTAPAGIAVNRKFVPAGETVANTIEWASPRKIQIKGEGGKVVFEQDDVVAPASWSEMAVQIVASKYFRGDEHNREASVRTLIERVTSTITAWGVKDGYFDTKYSAVAFKDELDYLMYHQMAAFNSPVWFNVGVEEKPQCSACFINSVEDSMEAILDLNKTEGMLFKFGSGTGSNLSTLRSSREKLKGGGDASGPISFMRGFDAFAGAIKSGGKCLAGAQMIYTAEGPKTVKELAERGEDFIVLSFDPPSNRYKAKVARAWKEAQQKEVVKITTDKGQFLPSFDHAMKLSTRQYVEAGTLQPGQSLFAGSVDAPQNYLRVHLRDGQKGKELLHRLVARDVMGQDIRGMVVHHRNANTLDNRPSNLEVKTPASHATGHSIEQVAQGEHIFQTQRFLKVGSANGMHQESTFWKSQAAVEYRAVKRADLVKSGRAAQMQRQAAQQKMINTAFKVMNAGGNIDTFDGYVVGRKNVVGPIASVTKLRHAIDERFGSYEKFVEEVRANNHRVVAVESLGLMDVYDVEVDCPTVDDKTEASGHNFLLWDGTSLTGSGVVVSNTRRAAKMIMLDADHGDIREFVQTKVKAEKMAKAMIAAGWSAKFNDLENAYNYVPFQNGNHSVRVSDDFMHRVERSQPWALYATTTGDLLEEIPAADLFDEIAQAAWTCGDPGLQFNTTINQWHTCPNTGPINGANPCSEFMFLDDSACNLASLNLMKFRNEDGGFNAVNFTHAVDVLILAMEIIVQNSSYPTLAIARNSHEYRPLGLGYANLGALLMSLGLPYDSAEGRDYAGTITALMHARAYRQSALIARSCGGPFAGFAENRLPMLEVMAAHANATTKLVPSTNGRITKSMAAQNAMEAWDDALRLGREYGFRNAQVTVLAPTGTIGYMMDCDTTGVEPDVSLVKTKKLVGGGTLRYVNSTVGMALTHLGYSPSQREQILSYLDKHDCIEAAPWLKEEHLPVFDCAFKPTKGQRSIDWSGHIKMMSAVQPFISGAISKTVNMPQEATVEDVKQAYKLAWIGGLKAIAIYRDGCKSSQPLSSGKDEAKPMTKVPFHVAPMLCAACGKDLKMKDDVVHLAHNSQGYHLGCYQPSRPSRRKLPATRAGVIHKFRVADHKIYLQVGEFPEGGFAEIFADTAKEGSVVSGLLGAFCVAISIGVQYGVPLQTFVGKFSHVRFEPSGFTGNPEIPMASSIVDYIFRWLGKRYLDAPEVPAVTQAVGPTVQVFSTSDTFVNQSDAPPCSTCGTLMVRNGSCHRCPNCGTTSGCS